MDDSAAGLVSLTSMLVALVTARGSDLLLSVGAPPTIRRHGELQPIGGYEGLRWDETELLARAMVTESQWTRFQSEFELDFAYTDAEAGRFRANLFRQRGHVGLVLRSIPTRIDSLDKLGMPAVVGDFASLQRGLVLVTGPTGSGKSTTLAAILDQANRNRSAHIVTIEDPIEFIHPHQRSIVDQREVGTDTKTFPTALRQALRQDPDIILVGELRDLETTATAISAAETGHLVLATLHTQSAAQTIDRIIDIFPANQQHEVRTQVSTSLQGVVSQMLVPRADSPARVAVVEVMLATPAIRNLIRESKSHQIPSFMQSGAADGMVTFDQHLAMLVRGGIVGREMAIAVSHSPDEFARLIGRHL